MKILVCGSRDWCDEWRITHAMRAVFGIHGTPGLACAFFPECNFCRARVVVHGDCRGADRIAGRIALQGGIKQIRAYPAEWDEHGRAAGPKRNRAMLEAEHTYDEPVDLCLAFHDDLSSSRGTRDMVILCRGHAKPIPVLHFHAKGMTVL